MFSRIEIGDGDHPASEESGIYRFTFPIKDYECTDIFPFSLYVGGPSCPTHELVKMILQRMDARSLEMADAENVPYDHAYREALRVMDELEKMGKQAPYLSHGMAAGSVQVNDIWFGNGTVPVEVQRIDIELIKIHKGDEVELPW